MHLVQRTFRATLLWLGVASSVFAASSVTLSVDPVTNPRSVHTIVLKSSSYDPVANTTTFVYEISSGAQPAISHWTLGIDTECRPPLVLAGAEAYGKDGSASPEFWGIKFPDGYEDDATRTETLVLAGRYAVGSVDLLVKPGRNFLYGTIDGPVCPPDPDSTPDPLTLNCPSDDDALVGPRCNDPGKTYATIALADLPAFTPSGGVNPVLSTTYTLDGDAFTPVSADEGAALRFPIGVTQVAVTATSAATQEQKSCSYQVYVDYCGPKLVGDGVIHSCARVVTFGAELFTSEQGEIVSFESTPASGTRFPLGTTEVAFRVADSAGNITEGTLQVVVSDTESPQIADLPDVELVASAGQCSAPLAFAAPLVIDCNLDTVTYRPALGTLLSVGSHTVTVTATDDAGNAPSEKSFTVTVVDREAPALTVSDLDARTDPGACSAVVTFAPVVSDNCPGATVETVPASGSLFAKGVTSVKVLAIDASGNTTEREFTVTVSDTEAPVVTVPADIHVSTDAGLCSALVVLDYSATDNCPGVEVSTDWPGGPFPKGVTTVTVSAVDAAGNSDTRSFTVTVTDTEAPVVTVPADITVSTDAGLCSALVALDYSATDNCPGLEVSSSWSGGPFPKGVTPVTIRAVDAAGNITEKSFTVTVVDQEAPTVSCPADILAFRQGVTSLVLDPGVAAYDDNCGATLEGIRDDGAALGDPYPAGVTVIRWVATDEAGNSAWCEQKIVVATTLGAGGGHTMGFWSNKNGQGVFNSNPGSAAMLNALNLRVGSGAHFVLPTTAAGLNTATSASVFSSWLNATSATNMAYMLSGQLAAMKMNVAFRGSATLARHGTGVDGSAYLYAPGTQSANAWGIASVNALLAEADASLGTHGLTPSGSPVRAYQDALKTALDRGNNNLNFVLIPAN